MGCIPGLYTSRRPPTSVDEGEYGASIHAPGVIGEIVDMVSCGGARWRQRRRRESMETTHATLAFVNKRD